MEKIASFGVIDSATELYHDSCSNSVIGTSRDDTITNSTTIALNSAHMTVEGQSKMDAAAPMSSGLGATPKTNLNITHNVGPVSLFSAPSAHRIHLLIWRFTYDFYLHRVTVDSPS